MEYETRVAAAPMNRTVCAWCRAEIRPGIDPVSHGACPPCFAMAMSSAGLELRVLACGARDYTNRARIAAALARMAPPGARNVTLLHGGAEGADALAAEVATGLGWTTRRFAADWRQHGRAAGPIRNRAMLDDAPDIVVAFHDNLAASKGTKDCVAEARRRHVTVWEIAGPLAPPLVHGRQR